MKPASAALLALCLAALAAIPLCVALGASRFNPVAEIPLSSLSATRDRPLFSPSRRPPPVAAEAPAEDKSQPQPQPAPSPELNLLGTVVGPSGGVALVAQGAELPSALHEGDAAWGWTLLAVGPRSATFQGRGGTMTLRLISAAPSP